MSEDDPYDIPDFLRISKEDRAAAWKGRKLTNGQAEPKKAAPKHDSRLPRDMTPEAWAILRSQQKAEAAKQKEKFAKLREKTK